MRWRTGRRSRNIEDRRGLRLSRRTKGSGLGIIVLALVALYFGVDPAIVLQGIPTETVTPTQAPPQDRSPQEDPLAEFVSVVLADTEDTWHALFSKDGRTYEEPVLVLFSGAVQSACGFARAAMGPFYCPADNRVYIDLSFYEDLRSRHGAPGDFAQAYVVAHEIGHHVQNLLGISHKVHTARQRAGKTQANRLSVMQELQADCFAGIWGYHADRSRRILEQGDIEEALNAASAIGDDRLQRQAQGYVTPESFTHGSSEQRVRWFRRGLENGELEVCDTYAKARL